MTLDGVVVVLIWAVAILIIAFAWYVVASYEKGKR